uniref:F-box domain-containing protein n=1 Tax=Syphacia muris TaxID=451379 RepID=A0A0N5AKS0_9BILA
MRLFKINIVICTVIKAKEEVSIARVCKGWNEQAAESSLIEFSSNESNEGGLKEEEENEKSANEKIERTEGHSKLPQQLCIGPRHRLRLHCFTFFRPTELNAYSHFFVSIDHAPLISSKAFRAFFYGQRTNLHS